MGGGRFGCDGFFVVGRSRGWSLRVCLGLIDRRGDAHSTRRCIAGSGEMNEDQHKDDCKNQGDSIATGSKHGRQPIATVRRRNEDEEEKKIKKKKIKKIKTSTRGIKE